MTGKEPIPNRVVWLRGTERKGKYKQGREFDEKGKPVTDIDHTDHGRPDKHSNPHQHDWEDNPTGGSKKRGDSRPLYKAK